MSPLLSSLPRYKSEWRMEEARRNLLRTHTTAASARALYRLAQQVRGAGVQGGLRGLGGPGGFRGLGGPRGGLGAFRGVQGTRVTPCSPGEVLTR